MSAVAWQRLLGAAWGGRAVALCRGLLTTPTRLQDLAKEAEKQSATDLSPLILQRNSMRWDGKVYEEIPIAHIKATYNKCNWHPRKIEDSNHPTSKLQQLEGALGKDLASRRKEETR
ncbi:28s ribosomal protein mitochondrial [Limosa lapponica baueri]|uniref:28s ribosomal protein mitochondrial n=1 Tax=Limosa lapponica baueri TaxID=1758121 RepID=A0A2I0UGU9_LIMLA|nr:28s ribosomal protein mitochondrial [Limosa lapponica baueri]